jgi:hypothetical protein
MRAEQNNVPSYYKRWVSLLDVKSFSTEKSNLQEAREVVNNSRVQNLLNLKIKIIEEIENERQRDNHLRVPLN